MVYINRIIQQQLTDALARQKNVLLLGPRQTGKTTLIQKIPAALNVSLIQPRTRLQYELDPSLLADEVTAIAEEEDDKPLIIIDEVQKVPLIMDVAQDLVDRQVAQFIFTGSSARKLIRGDSINLLPGRVIPLRMDPLNISEIPDQYLNLDDLLFYGSLPSIVLTKSAKEKEELLDAYVSIYLEEEIRAEALVRNLANFARFLELASSESGYAANQSKLSQSIGVAHTTIAGYYQILEDCLVAERIEPVTESKTRHKLLKSNKYIIFDLGLRRLAAREGIRVPQKYKGHLFEQFITLELIRHARPLGNRAKIKYWHDAGSNVEVDCVIDTPDLLIPVAVKYTERPTVNDAKHIMTFLNEYEKAEKGYILCQGARRMKLADNIYALPWQELPSLFD